MVSTGMDRHVPYIHFSIKELTPIIIAMAIWGKDWYGDKVQVLSDNSSAVATVNNKTSMVQESAYLLHDLAFLSAQHQCELVATNIPGRHNTLADALSRNNLMLFRSLHPQALLFPTTIPLELLDLLILECKDWKSHHWTELWSATLNQVNS